MKTKLHLFTGLFLTSLMTFAQDPNPTTNTLITGVTIESFFAEQNNPPDKVNIAANAIDGDVDTDWAGESVDPRGEAFIIDLEGSYDLAEVQFLTVLKTPAYLFEIWVSTSTAEEFNFVKYFDGPDKLESNLDNTYKSFVFPTAVADAKFVMFKCYGRSDSGWNTISELRFYSASTASTKENEISGFSLYPNPVKDTFTLSNLSNKVSKVQIIDLLGKVILSKSIENFEKELTVDTSFLVNGIYLVKLSDSAGSLSASQKMVIQH